MFEVPPSQPEWTPVAEAAHAAGVPPRTVYRWIKEKRLPSRREGKALLVDLSAVLVLAQDRAIGAPLSAPGADALPTRGTAGKVVQPLAVDGQLAGQVFALFDEGVAAIDVVRRLSLAPQTVQDLHRQYTSLRDLGGGGQLSIADRVAAVEKEQAALRQGQKKLDELQQWVERGTTEALQEVWHQFEKVAHEANAASSVIAEEILKRPTASCGHCNKPLNHLPSICVPCANHEAEQLYRQRRAY